MALHLPRFRSKRSVHAFKHHRGRRFADLYEGNPSYNGAEYATGGAPFIVLKASEGIGHIDSRHAARSVQSHAHGTAVGHYHFLRPESGRPELEARHFWQTVAPHFLTVWQKGEGHDSYPHSHTDFLIVDVEVGQNSKEIMDSLSHFCRELLRVSKVGVPKLVGYTGKSFLFEHSLHIPGDKWWIADYPTFPGDLGHGRELWAHQFTDRGQIPGISGTCDCSVLSNRSAIRYWGAQ